MKDHKELYDPQLFGASDVGHLLAVELKESSGSDKIFLYSREGDKTSLSHDEFKPFILAAAEVARGCPEPVDISELHGSGRLNVKMVFQKWKDCLKAKTWLASTTGFSPSAPNAPYLFINDPVQQYMMYTGKTLFKGMSFESLSRMQVDIECTTTDGYEFCNAEREGDGIIAIAFADQSGWTEVLSVMDMNEKAMLERFVSIVRERNPDIIEGHNIFNFDLPYIQERARRHGVKLALGRDGSVPKTRPGRFSAGERTIAYKRFDIFGRHVVDTLFMVHIYDVSHRSLSGFGLKEVAVHFGLAAQERTYINGADIASEFRKNPRRVLKYVTDDVVETRALSTLLSRSNFIQAQILPYSYQNVCVRGNATKIDALMIREYMRKAHALPLPELAREFAGGYTDMFKEGVIMNVHHCDVRSLYPSLMLSRKIGPESDELGIFLGLLDSLRSLRFVAKNKMLECTDEMSRNYYDASQSVFKILINSFYGYLGFAQGHFNDFSAAERITEQGRQLLADMIDWLKKLGATPVEIDTDGIYFVPPDFEGHETGATDEDIESFRKSFAKSLPDGIDVEFDGEYKSMYSYKMKNYALLANSGEVIIKGAALKSRGLEPFQREFLESIIKFKLTGESDKISALKNEYEKAIVARKWPIAQLAKTETLQDAPKTYEAKRAKGQGSRRAVYELALRSDRDYRAGDQVSYYVTGEKKSVAVHENSKLVSEWDPLNRDENTAYYLAKMDALNEKFGIVDRSGEFYLDGV